MAAVFTIGADPEIFITKNSKAVSAFGLIEGTKTHPFKTDRGAYQVDGMALEFNIDPSPIDDFEQFDTNIVQTMSTLKKAVPGYKFNISPVQDFDPAYLEEQPDEAKELGCDPDYSAYTLEPNPRPDGEKSFRTGAGHIHIGWGSNIPVDNPDHIEICAGFVKVLDATVGMFMTYIDREPRRRELYGKAGAMRVKPYGVEYRTPSNAWITTKDRRKMIHLLVNIAIRFHTTGTTIKNFTGVSSDEIVDIIDTGNFTAALRVCDNLLYGPKEWSRIKKDFAPSAVEEGFADDDLAVEDFDDDE